MKTLNYKHSGNSGDTIYALSFIKRSCEVTDSKANLYLRLDVEARYINDMPHPIYSPEGKNVMLNIYMFNMIAPLIDAQPYINEVKIWEGEHIDIDLDLIRDGRVDMSKADIRKWYGYIFHDAMPDIAEQAIWLNQNWLEERYYETNPNKAFEDGYIMVNRTQRYRNDRITYMFLRNVGLPIIFAGATEEYELFQKEVPNAIKFNATDFLHLAWWIREAKVFIGNQSMCFAIAEQMKSRRILEVCPYIPNVITVGGETNEFYTQNAFEDHVKKIID